MANYLPIVKTLESININVRGLGQVVVDPATIEVGNNSVVARCRVVGGSGYKTIKCYLTPSYDEDTERLSYYPKSLRVYSFSGKVEYVDVAIGRWINGEPLDSVVYRSACDYGVLSREFDKMALKHIQSRGIHGDIKPENIIVTTSGAMKLVDNDSQPVNSQGNCRAKDYGSSYYAHRLRSLRRTDEYTDYYPLALLSALVATLKYSPTFIDEVRSMDEYIADATTILRDNGDYAHYNMLVELQRSIMGKVENLEELMREAVERADRGEHTK